MNKKLTTIFVAVSIACQTSILRAGFTQEDYSHFSQFLIDGTYNPDIWKTHRPLEVLGLSVNVAVTNDEITKRYRELSVRLHPDKNKGQEELALAFFQLVDAAKERAIIPQTPPNLTSAPASSPRTTAPPPRPGQRLFPEINPLHFAAQEGRANVIPFLLNKGANVNATPTAGPYQGVTPLHVATKYKKENVVQLLLENGANVNAVATAGPYQGLTPLHVAAVDFGYLTVSKILLENGANVNAVATAGPYQGVTPLHVAANNNNYIFSQDLLEKGANVNAVATAGPLEGLTPLHVAAKHNSSNIVYFLWGKGANVNAAATAGPLKGLTPLHVAALFGHKDIAKILLENGANVNAVATAGPHQGITPLDVAAQFGRSNVANIIRFHLLSKRKFSEEAPSPPDEPMRDNTSRRIVRGERQLPNNR